MFQYRVLIPDIEKSPFVVQGAQFIVATHSPILLGLPGAQILQFDDDGVRPCDYEDTDAYRITASFINHRDVLLRHLFADEER